MRSSLIAGLIALSCAPALAHAAPPSEPIPVVDDDFAPISIVAPEPSPAALRRASEDLPIPRYDPGLSGSMISGLVKDEATNRPIEYAFVSLSCTCLMGPLEILTNVRGIYSFTELPGGTYTLEVFAPDGGKLARRVHLPAKSRVRINLATPSRSSSAELIVVEGPIRREVCVMVGNKCTCKFEHPNRERRWKKGAERRENRRERRFRSRSR